MVFLYRINAHLQFNNITILAFTLTAEIRHLPGIFLLSRLLPHLVHHRQKDAQLNYNRIFTASHYFGTLRRLLGGPELTNRAGECGIKIRFEGITDSHSSQDSRLKLTAGFRGSQPGQG